LQADKIGNEIGKVNQRSRIIYESIKTQI